MSSKTQKKLVINPSLETTLTIHARQRGKLPNTIKIPLDSELLDLVKALAKVAKLKPGTQRFPSEIKRNEDLLVEMGVLISSDSCPQKVVPQWTLSKKQLEWVPKVFRDEAEATLKKQGLIFNKELVRFSQEVNREYPNIPGIPPSSTFPLEKSLLWVLDPGTRIWAPYQPNSSTLKVIEDLSEGKRKVGQLDEDLLEVLWHSRILVHKNYRQEREIHWNTHWLQQREQLKSERYAILRRIVTPMQIAILRSYFRKMEYEGYLDIDENQVKKKRYFKHNDPMLQYVHRQSGQLVRQMSGEAILPSYSYVSAYMPDAALVRHVDRPQCKWNASLLIDENPEVSLEKSWPMFIETHKGSKEVRLDFGDAVFYSGTELFHWRDSIGPKNRQTLGLLHYVPIDFVGSLD